MEAPIIKQFQQNKGAAKTAKMDAASFTFKSGSEKKVVTVKDWLDQVQAGTADLLQEADKIIDGQVGALGSATEYVLNTKREVPLFEFRDIFGIKPSEFKAKVEDIEAAIVAFHKKYPTAPVSSAKRWELWAESRQHSKDITAAA